MLEENNTKLSEYSLPLVTSYIVTDSLTCWIIHVYSIYTSSSTNTNRRREICDSCKYEVKSCFLFAYTNDQREWWVTSCSEFWVQAVTKGKEKTLLLVTDRWTPCQYSFIGKASNTRIANVTEKLLHQLWPMVTRPYF